MPAVHRSRHGDRLNAVLRHFANALVLQKLNGQSGGRPAAGVEAVKLAAFRVVHDGEKIAAHAVHHGRDEAHHGVGGHGRIDGVSAMLENLRAGLRRERRFRGNDAVARDHHGASLVAVRSANSHVHCEYSA